MTERSKYQYGSVPTEKRSGVGKQSQRAVENENHGNEKKSMFVVGLMVLLSETCRGILLPTLWLRVQSVGGSPASQGITVACLSLGRLIGSLFLGLSADCFNYKSALFGSTLLIVLGSLTYVFAETLNTLFAAQLILGLGSGSLSVGKAYFTEISSSDNKVTVMAYLGAIQSAGFTLFPIVGSLIATKTRQHGYTTENPWYGRISSLTIPAVVLGAFATVSGLLVLLLFKEPSCSYDSKPTNQRKRLTESKEADEELTRVLSSEPAREYDARMRRCGIYAIIGCLLQFLIKGAISTFETLLTFYAMNKFDWNEMQIGTSISMGGVIAVVLLLCFPLFIKICSDVDVLIVGILFMIAANLLLDAYFIPYEIHEWRFQLSIILMFGVGYPICNSALLGVFSKLLTGEAGVSIGSFSAFGSLARIIGPIFSGAGAEKYGVSAVFTTVGLLLMGGVLVPILGRNKVVHDLH